MSGRSLGPLWLDEFTAGYLEDLLHDELETLKEQLAEHRDNANGLAWANVKLQTMSIHRLWCSLHHHRGQLGEPLPDDVESRQQDVERWSHSMPRSKANAGAWAERKQAERERRARLAEARKLARKGMRSRVGIGQSVPR